jgi:hypothetical protein
VCIMCMVFIVCIVSMIDLVVVAHHGDRHGVGGAVLRRALLRLRRLSRCRHLHTSQDTSQGVRRGSGGRQEGVRRGSRGVRRGLEGGQKTVLRHCRHFQTSQHTNLHKRRMERASIVSSPQITIIVTTALTNGEHW